MAITSRDRTELKSLVKARFNLLRGGLRVRYHDVRVAVEGRIRREHEPQLNDARKAAELLLIDAEKLGNQWKELQDACKEAGVVLNHPTMSELRMLHRYSTDVGIENMAGLVNQEMTRLHGASLLSDIGLEQLELECLERLFIEGAVEDKESAQKYLESLPTLETILPLPNGEKPVRELDDVEDELRAQALKEAERQRRRRR